VLFDEGMFEEYDLDMKRDIYKLASWLERVCQEGVALEHKILEWKLSGKRAEPAPRAKAS